MDYGQITMILTTPDDDAKGNTDCFLNNLRIAWRTRRFSINKWREISIRAWRISGVETEMQKILNGKAKAQLYIFEFLDAWIVCTFNAVKNCLGEKFYHIEPNHDGTTKAAYISLDDIEHLFISKRINQ